jgi:hypothetical protein
VGRAPQRLADPRALRAGPDRSRRPVGRGPAARRGARGSGDPARRVAALERRDRRLPVARGTPVRAPPGRRRRRHAQLRRPADVRGLGRRRLRGGPETWALDDPELAALAIAGVDASFADDETKASLRTEIEGWLAAPDIA